MYFSLSTMQQTSVDIVSAWTMKIRRHLDIHYIQSIWDFISAYDWESCLLSNNHCLILIYQSIYLKFKQGRPESLTVNSNI